VKDDIANLLDLVLPYGATSGRRIVLDGTAGLIDIYDTAGALRAELGPVDGFRLFSADPSELTGGHLKAVVLGAGATRRLALVEDSPQFSGLLFPTLLLASQSFDGTIPTEIDLSADLVAITGLAGNADLQLNSKSLPRGIVGTPAISIANDAARAAGVNTDLAVTFTADATRLYRVHLKSQLNIGTVAVTMALDLSEGGTVGVNDGTAVDRLMRWNASETATATLLVNASVLYRPAAGAVTIRVRNDSGSGGTVTLTGSAGAGVGSRCFWVEDIGAR
jgi:hypothetical protein